jgi:ABC-2 type transport system permease protein
MEKSRNSIFSALAIKDLTQLLLWVGIAIFLNIISNYWNFRLDLTEEKRFTLSNATKKITADVGDVVYVNVLLEGKFPAGFKRLRDATEDMLKQLRKINPRIEYSFEDPSAGNAEQVNARRKELSEMGVLPVNLKIMEAGERTEKLIFPVAIFNLGTRRLFVNLLEHELAGATPEENLNISVSLLEYKFASALQKMTVKDKPIIFFSEGRGELDSMETIDLENFLDPYYTLGRLHIDSVVQISPQIDLLIIAKPNQVFSEKDKFKLDQYVMNGGKVILMMDKLHVGLDSLRNRAQFIPPENETELDDLLFKYGVRLNPDLVLDLECSRIPLTVGMLGNKPQVELFDWYYHPIVTPLNAHPITKSLDRINLKFPCSIDTIKTKTDIKKTVLLQSSRYTRTQVAPVPLTFEILRYEKDPSKFNKEPKAMAVLLEGEFPSLFENRVTGAMLSGMKEMGMEFRERSVSTKFVVISDGDMARNSINRETGQYNPLGFNVFENYRFANREFLINTIEYLLDEKGVLDARSREVRLRLLDTIRAESERLTWQLVNIAIPLVLLMAFGFGFFYWRKRRYGLNKSV